MDLYKNKCQERSGFSVMENHEQLPGHSQSIKEEISDAEAYERPKTNLYPASYYKKVICQ